MRKLVVIVCAATVFFGIAVSAQALPINGGFETGDLSGWNYSGDVSVDTSFTIGSETYNPTEGNYLAMLGSTETSGIWFDDLMQMDSFDVIMTPQSGFTAWVRVVIDNQSPINSEHSIYNPSDTSVILDVSDLTSLLPDNYCASVYGVGVDQGNTIFVDNVSGHPCPAVPEPATMLLLGFGLMGLAGFRRKFKG